ncbi:MAG: hypothetical protein N2557_07120 [Hydrogenophilus sp.]|nr:hypothetical protein [Hydrogenophilus sp.]
MEGAREWAQRQRDRWRAFLGTPGPRGEERARVAIERWVEEAAKELGGYGFWFRVRALWALQGELAAMGVKPEVQRGVLFAVMVRALLK